MPDFFSIIHHMDLFKDLSIEMLENIFTKEIYTIKAYQKNSVIYLPNETCTTFDIILKGIVSVQGIDDEGNYISITDFHARDVIGGNLLFSHENYYPMMVLSANESTILHIRKDLILTLCQTNQNFLIQFLQELSNKTLILTDKIKTLSFKSIRQCIIDFLLYEKCIQNSNRITLSLTKKQLAEKFGVQRPSLSRELNKMRKEGLLTYDAHSITILNEKLFKN